MRNIKCDSWFLSNDFCILGTSMNGHYGSEAGNDDSFSVVEELGSTNYGNDSRLAFSDSGVDDNDEF